MKEYILTVDCPDIAGIVAAVTGFITEKQCFIIEATQFGDPITKQFFQRIHFSFVGDNPTYEQLSQEFSAKVADKFKMNFALHLLEKKPNIVIMVSKFGHCLNDLLHRVQSKMLAINIPAVISNHRDMRNLVEWHNIPFYYIPAIKNEKDVQERQIMQIINDCDVDLVVLARYMQILSPDLCYKLAGKAINIHHSFLPSFKGAKPYHQAHERGVKIIGATAHYITEKLDEGPIIEQEVTRVDHTMSPNDFVAMGKDIESRVLARAVKYHTEHRVLLNGSKTVVFN